MIQTTGGQVRQVVLDARRWALIPAPVPLPDPVPLLNELAARVGAAQVRQSPGGRVALARITRMDSRLGPAVLLVCPGQVTICCPAQEISEQLAAAAPFFAAAVSALWPAGRPRRVRISRVQHASLPAALHPCVLRGRPVSPVTGVTAEVCAEMISAAAAQALSVLSAACSGAAPAYAGDCAGATDASQPGWR